MRNRLARLIVFFLLLACTSCQNAPTATGAAPVTQPTAATAGVASGSSVSLQIAAPEKTVSFTLDELKKLPVSEGYAGIKSSTGKITPPAIFKGVLLNDLVAKVGGMGEGMGLQVEAEDGYFITFSPDEVMNGTFIAYDPVTGDELKPAPVLKAMVAYEREGQPLDAVQDGSLRLVVISEKNNQVTDGHWSVKWTRKLSIKPLAAEWTLELDGFLQEKIDRATFESGAAPKCHQASWKDAEGQEWIGIPLWYLTGYVDDDVKHSGPAYNSGLADKGYKIDLVAKDGFTVTFDSARVKRNNNMIVAYMVNGSPLAEKDFPLRLVGADVQKGESVGGIAKVVLHLESQAAAPAPTVAPSEAPATVPAVATSAPASPATGGLSIVGLVNNPLSLNIDALKNMDVVKISVEHPKKGKMDVEGVRLNTLLSVSGIKAGAAKLVMTASDGFNSEASLKDIQGCKDCLVSFGEGGALNLSMPGLPSNLWVKGVVNIEVQ